jgi:CRP/FNR family cyclic AMP-dependent transcriptional regulator
MPEPEPFRLPLLEADPDLSGDLGGDRYREALRRLAVAVLPLRRGPWFPSRTGVAGGEPPFGMLVLEGLLVREATVGDHPCAELLGPGDLLRPWDYADGAGESVASDSSWTVLEPMRVAILDDRFARVACRWPQLMAGLVSRTLRRSRWMTIMLGISNLTRVDQRVVAIMWHLADRWGHVTPDGVVVPVPLTHEMIGRLVGAHRPSVTSALGELNRDGVLERRDDGWLLRREPPDLNGGGRKVPAVDPTFLASLPALAAGVLG